jgi:hypothetical protein
MKEAEEAINAETSLAGAFGKTGSMEDVLEIL